MASSEAQIRRLAWRFILTVGMVNLFADMTYEGARAVTGDFLGQLGANGTIVGIVAGGGELAGYVVRLISGAIADRTGRYWEDTWAGYLVNMLCVPALALARTWPIAAGLMIGERVGRGIRRPAMSAIISRAGKDLGSGKIFGVNEALDQIGGAAGPLIVALALSRMRNFHLAFGILLVPAIVTLGVLGRATVVSRGVAERIERKPAKSGARFSSRFWIYVIGGALFAAGYADFALIAYHLGHANVASAAMISVWYAMAMITTAIMAPILGHAFDRVGMVAVAIPIAFSAAATPLAFIGRGWMVPLGVAMWGVGTAVQDSLFVAMIADVTAEDSRSTAFGVFDTIYGVAWMAGSAALGVLYDHFVWGLIIVSLGAQIAAAVVFLANTARR